MTAWDFKADDKGMTYPEPMAEIPAEFAEIAAEKRSELLDAAAEYDDELMMMVLEDEESPSRHAQGPPSAEGRARQLSSTPFSWAPPTRTRASSGASRRCRGLPAEPARHSARAGHQPGHRRGGTTARPTSTSPFSALAFKIMTDPYVGKLTFFRVYSGHVDAGSYVVNATNGPARALRSHPRDERQRAC